MRRLQIRFRILFIVSLILFLLFIALEFNSSTSPWSGILLVILLLRAFFLTYRAWLEIPKTISRRRYPD